jgi:hypothetical protein
MKAAMARDLMGCSPIGRSPLPCEYADHNLPKLGPLGHKSSKEKDQSPLQCRFAAGWKPEVAIDAVAAGRTSYGEVNGLCGQVCLLVRRLVLRNLTGGGRIRRIRGTQDRASR